MASILSSLFEFILVYLQIPLLIISQKQIKKTAISALCARQSHLTNQVLYSAANAINAYRRNQDTKRTKCHARNRQPT